MANSYGDQAPEIAKLAGMTRHRWPVIGKRLVADYPYIEAEVKYVIHKEYACTAVDVLARRTRLAFQNVQAAHESLPRIVEIMAKELKWSKAETKVNVSKDSQKTKKKRKTPKVTDESGIPRNSCLSQWKRRRRKLLYPHPKLSLSLVPCRPFTVNRCSMLNVS